MWGDFYIPFDKKLLSILTEYSSSPTFISNVDNREFEEKITNLAKQTSINEELYSDLISEIDANLENNL